MKRLRKFLLFMLILLLAAAGLFYYAWQHTFNLSGAALSSVRDYVTGLHNIDFDAENVRLNMPEHIITANKIKVMLPGQKPFIEAEEALIYFASGTGPLDLYFSRAVIEKVEITGLNYDATAPQPQKASDDAEIPRIPAREIIVNGLKLNTSVSVFNVPDFKARMIRTRRNANVELSFEKSPIGGHARLIAMLGLNTGEARIKFNWQQNDFSGFIPLIFLSHRFGLNILSGGATISLDYNGNLLEQIRNPGKNLAKLLNKEVRGRLSINDCGFQWAGVSGKVNLNAERKPENPWKYALDCDIGKGNLAIAGNWSGAERSLTDFTAQVNGENLSLSKKAFEYLGINLRNTEPGNIDFAGEFTGDLKKITGNGLATARSWKYQNKTIHQADLKWSISEDFRFMLAGELVTEIGDLIASSTTWFAGSNKGQGSVTGDFDQIDLQKLKPFITSPVAGKCSGPFKVDYDLAHPASTTYDMHLEMLEGHFYSLKSERVTARIFGSGTNWNLANPVAYLPDNGKISLDGLVTSKKFAAKARLENIDLQAFGVPQRIASGAISVNASIGGPLLNPSVKGEIWGGKMSLMKIDIESCKAQLLIQGTTLTLSPLVIQAGNDAVLDGYFSIDLRNGKIKFFKLAFQNLPLQFFRNILPPRLAGKATEGVIAGHVSYNSERAQNFWDFYIDGRKLLLADQQVDSIFLEGNIIGRQTELKNMFVKAFGGTVSVSGQVTDNQDFSGSIEAESLQFEQMKFVRDLIPDLRGEVSLQGQVDWKGSQRSGAFTVFSRNIKTRDRDLGNFGGELLLDDKGLRITNGEFDKLGLKINGDIDFQGRRPYQAELQLENVDLSFIPEAHGITTFDYGGLLVTGKCKMQGDLASLTPDVINMQVDSVRIQKENDVIVSNRPMQVIYQNNGVEIRSLELKYRQGVLGVEGVFTPGKNVALMVNGKNFSMKALGQLFDLPNWNYDGSLSINARLFGDVDDVKLKATADIAELMVGGKKIPEVRAKLDGDKSGVDIEDALVKLPFSSFNLKGRVDFAEKFVPANINLHLFVPYGPINDLTNYLPQVFREASGTIKADLMLTGKPANPEISGKLHLTADQLAFSNMRKPLTKVDFDISTNDRIINIDTLQANLGRGKLTGSGQINFRDALGSITANISGQKLDLSFMNLELSNASASVAITGDLYNPILAGKVFVPRGKFNLTSNLLAKRKPVDFIFDSLNYRFDFVVPRNFWLKSSFLNSEMRGKFAVFGDLKKVNLDGGISCVQGKLYFKQRQFKIETGEIRFGGVDDSLDPQIFVKSEGQIQSTKVFLTLQGRVSSFSTQIYSTPPMAEGDLLALLTLGRSLDTAMHSDSKELFESEILNGLKDSYISALIGSTISTALNLDELFLSSLYDKTSGKSRSFVRVGKYIGQNIFMAYEGTMEQGRDETYIFEYRLPKGFVVNIEFKEPIKEQRIGVRYDWKFW